LLHTPENWHRCVIHTKHTWFSYFSEILKDESLNNTYIQNYKYNWSDDPNMIIQLNSCGPGMIETVGSKKKKNKALSSVYI
jgi:hypothetical protein